MVDYIVAGMNAEERDIYNNGTATEYFDYIINTEKFSSIYKNLLCEEPLSQEDWYFVVNKLVLTACKARDEEEKIFFYDRVIYAFNKLVNLVAVPNSSLYKESSRIIEYYNFIKKDKEINKDLFKGFCSVMDTELGNYLILLIKQHKEASIYRECKDSFIDNYFSNDEITQKEVITANSGKRAYDREKKLVLLHKIVI